MVGVVVLKRGKEKPVQNRHPWIFSGAIARIEGDPANGDIVDVLAHDRSFLARGYINRQSQITVRLLTWDAADAVDSGFWRRHLLRAVDYRRTLIEHKGTNAYRLVYGESDLLPGLVVDRYGDYLVVQVLTLGIERFKAQIVALLADIVHPRGIYERSDVDVRDKEDLPSTRGLLWGEEPPSTLEIRENGYCFAVDIVAGQKTGFYLDQRVNRLRLKSYTQNRRVLNAFAYTGGFGVYAAAGGAREVVHIDTSADALELARANLERNDLGEGQQYLVGDVFQVLRQYRATGERFDLIVLDPPKFAYSQAQVQHACRGYKDINLLALQLLQPDGILFTMSCSGLVSADLFQKVVFGASVDARREVQIVEPLAQSPDHPILLTFPEGQYLKGFACRVL